MLDINPDRNIVIAIVAQNENGVLQAGSEAIGTVFAGKGYHHHVIDMYKPAGGEELMSLLASGRVAFGYGYAGVGSQLNLTTGANIWTASKTPFMCLWFDHPAYNYRQHIVDSLYVVHCYHVLDHLEARQRYLPKSSSQSVLLHLTDGAAIWAKPYPMVERPHHILFAKTAFQPAVLAEDWRRHPKKLQEVIWSLVEQAKKDRNLDLANATAVLLTACGVALDNYNLFMGIIQEVDGYIRAWRSDMLGRALLQHPAHIYGRGWDYLKDESRRAEFFLPISAQEHMKKNLEYKIIANSNPLWRDGIHERVQIGICFGSVVLTDHTVKSQTLFGDAPNYIGFEWDDNLQDVIAEALRRADDYSVDYFATVEKILSERVIEKTPDYIEQIEKVANVVREQQQINDILS